MCGVAGRVGPGPLDQARATRCLALAAHRGPDSAGRASLPGPGGRSVDLLHTRLSIIDLDDRAAQPFCLGPLTLVVNGELYNYVELRRELEAEGRSFTTSSDTEVLAHALHAWGDAAFDRFEGMWALAVHDARDGSLTLSRDRFGEKPLYLLHDGEALLFGSEPKLVAALVGRVLAPDVEHLYRYLVNGYKALYKVDSTFHEGLAELPPATVLRVDAHGEERRWRYWEPRFAPQEDMTYEEAVAGARERLVRAVELRLRADVPIAFCMSGGVDSLSLIGIARRELGREVHGFTIANTDERYEEADMVELAARELGVRHTWVRPSTDGFLELLRQVVGQHDAPLATITYFTHWLLVREIGRAGYRISISGTGADELFSGYYDHHLAYLREVSSDPALHAASRAAWERHVRPLVRNPYLRDADYFVRDPERRDHVYLGAEEFAAYLHEGFAEPFAEARYADDLLRNRMLNELFHEAVPVILHEDDLNAMAFSLENRSPFLDRELFEHCYSIPTRHLVRDGRAKAVLRDAMRGLVPDAALDNRRKVGFNAPIHDLLGVDDPAVRARVLADGPLYEHVRRDRVAALLEKRQLPNSESKLLFNLVNAQAFLEAA